MAADIKPAAVDRDFIDTVAKDVRGQLGAELKEWLHEPKMLDRRYSALIALKKDIEIQLSTQKARWIKKRHEIGGDGEEWVEWKAGEADWRVRAIKFLGEVEDHISAAKEEKRRRASTETVLNELVTAIDSHKDSIEPDDATPADRRLWDLRDKVSAVS